MNRGGNSLPVRESTSRVRSYSAVENTGEESAFTKARKNRDAEMYDGTMFLFDLTKMREPSFDYETTVRTLGFEQQDQNMSHTKKDDSRLDMSRQYVPKYVVDYFAKRHKPIAKEHEEMFYAAVLFVDISGFTKLTEKLSQNAAKTSVVNVVSESKREQKGKAKDHDEDKQTMERGAEQLVEHLNKYFDQIITIIERWGGDIIKFAGDAMLCTFDTNSPENDRSKLQRALIQACSCAEELHAINPQVRTVDTVQLKLHIGVGAGKLRFVFVGGNFSRWEYLVADTEEFPGPVFQIGEAEPVAEPDETVVHKHAFEYISDQFTKASLVRDPKRKVAVGYRVEKLKRVPENPSSLAPPDAMLPDDEVYLIENFVPAAIKSRLDSGDGGAGSSKWMCDLRRVTILFINVQGLKTSSPKYLEKLQFSMEVIQSCLYAEEGSVNKYLSDDKGTTLIAGFGLPPLSHRDDPLRGVRAAIRIMQRMVEESPQWDEDNQDENVHKNIFASADGALLPAIGITTGNCFCGIVGGSRRKEYTMMGDIVNLAARLMQAARGDVVVDKNTYEESVKEINYDIRPAIKVKGKKDPIPIFSPDPERNTIASLSLVRERRRTAFVGREEVMSQFQDTVLDLHLQHWDKTNQVWREQPDGKVVHVTGEVGIGKSRIGDQFMNVAAGDASNPDMLVVLGEGKENDKYCFNCWVPIVLNLIALLNDMTHQSDVPVEDQVGPLPDQPKKRTMEIKRTRSEQWQEYHQQRLDAHDMNLSLAARESAKRQERSDIVRRQAQRYQRLRGMPSSRFKKDFPPALLTDLKKMLLEQLGDNSPDFETTVDLLFEVLQVSHSSVYSRGERGPELLVGPRLKQARKHEQHVTIDGEKRAELLKNRKRVINLILALIEKVNTHYPLMIVVEDANFMEDESWDLTASLCRAKLPILFCIVENMQRRDQWREKNLVQFYADISCDPSRLFDVSTPRMSETEIVKLAKAHWDATNIPMEVLDMLVRRSEGNPLFCERLMETLSSRQIVKVRHDSNGKAHVLLIEKDQLYWVRIDPGLMTMIRARLDKLPASLQRTLKLASIIASCNLMLSNPIFTVHLLCFLDVVYKRGQQSHSLEDLLKRLKTLAEEKEIIDLVEFPGQSLEGSSQIGGIASAYRFRSPLFRDVVYRSLPFAERQHLHSILAKSIQFQLDGARSVHNPEVIGLVDRHWRRWNELVAENSSLSGDEKSSFQRCLLVGEYCLHNNADRRASELLEKALNSYARIDVSPASNNPEMLRSLKFMGTYAHHLYGLATFRLGQMEQAKHSLQVALKCLEKSIPTSKLEIFKATMADKLHWSFRSGKFTTTRSVDSVSDLRPMNASKTGAKFMVTTSIPTLKRIGSDLLAIRWTGPEPAPMTDEDFDVLLAQVFTWLAVVYFESNEKDHGDWASAHAISLFQRAAHISASDLGLVSLAYAHACVNSQMRGQASKAVAYQTKALHFFRKLTDDSHTHARVDVLYSIAQFDAACGRFEDATIKLIQCVKMSKEIGDLRVWEKCITELGHVYLISGQPMDALSMFFAVCQSCKSATADRSNVEKLALHGLAHALLALGMAELADETIVYLQTSNNQETSRAMPLWLLGRYERALFEANRVLNLPPQSFNSMWMQYWTTVTTLDVLFAQWMRLLSTIQDLTNSASANSTLVDDKSGAPSPASSQTRPPNATSSNEPKPGILGLGETVDIPTMSKKQKKNSLVTTSRVFIDDLAAVSSIEKLNERLPTIIKPTKKLLQDLKLFAAHYPFASHTLQVYESIFELVRDSHTRDKQIAHMFKPPQIHAMQSRTFIPRDKATAVWFGWIATWGPDGQNSPERTLTVSKLEEMVQAQLVPDTLLHRRIRILEGTQSLSSISGATSGGLGKVMAKVNSKLISELSVQRTELRITFDDIDELDSDFQMECADAYLLTNDARVQLLEKATRGDNTLVLSWEWVRKIKLILKTQQFKSWQLDAQVQDDMLDLRL
eukprot:c11967_g2_i1.p1 GENE.c11967_g2_i1~~c11967_g2_i1.p1  ORF type:complete len:1983 (+),score=533.48 c11967_g2_i1:122-6070(+)